MALFDYQCDEGHVHEFMRPASTDWVFCPDCGRKAERRIGAPSMIVGPTLHPNLTRPKAYQESKERAEHGFRHLGVARP